jgi:predicted ATP-binding protein involved in virulence
MKITHLDIANFRLFKKLSIDFHPQLTVLVAPNGGGKTTVLEAVHHKICSALYYKETRSTDRYIFPNNVSALKEVKLFFKGTPWEDRLETPIKFGCGIDSLIYTVNHIASNSNVELVLLDNIEQSLHPELQQTILRRFTDTFPLVQFIVTTNSPIVLSTVRKENIRVLLEDPENDGVYEANEPDFSPLAHRSNDALGRIMGVSPAPPWELTEARQQFEWYVRNNQEDTEEALLLRQKLDDAGYEFHDSDLSSWRFIASRKKAKGI